MPSFPWRPIFLGTPATEDCPFHAMIEYHRCPPNASIISCFDKKKYRNRLQQAHFPLFIHVRQHDTAENHSPFCKRSRSSYSRSRADASVGSWARGSITAMSSGRWALAPSGCSSTRKRRCIRHGHRPLDPAKGRRPAGRCGKQPRRPNHRRHPRGTDRPKIGYRSPPLRSVPAPQGLNGPAVLLAAGDRTPWWPTSSGSTKSGAVASSGHPPLFLCPHCTKKYRSRPSKRPLMRPLYVRNPSIFTGKITPGGKKHPSG